MSWMDPSCPDAEMLSASSEAPHTQHEPLVMAIDDSQTVRTVVKYSLARAGVRVITFPDGLSAIRALSSESVEAPDLILLDIDLPRMDGYEVAAVLHSMLAFRRIRIVMLSAHGGMVDRVRCRMIGVRDFIRKPFHTQELVDAVLEFLRIGAPTIEAGDDVM